jgi:hypothetical protein
MEYIDKYFGSAFYVCDTYYSPNISSSLKSTLRTDLVKTMMIGATLSIALRFSISVRFYLFKDYLKSAACGSLFGVAYSPYFLSRKIDQ